jgi:hypothetical protein
MIHHGIERSPVSDCRHMQPHDFAFFYADATAFLLMRHQINWRTHSLVRNYIQIHILLRDPLFGHHTILHCSAVVVFMSIGEIC